MRRFYAIGFLVLLAFDTLGQVGFKLAAEAGGEPSASLRWLAAIFADKWIYLSVCGYLGAFFTWMTLLKHAPIGPAFAASHLEIVSVLAISVTVLGETLSFRQAVGALLILAGIGVLATQRVPKPDDLA